MSQPSTLFQHLPPIRWWLLCLGAVITGILSLSVHVVLQQVFDVPYPEGFPQAGWGFQLNSLVTSFSIIVLCRLLQKRSAGLGLAARCLLVFLLVTMLRELFFRIAFMNGFVTGAWLYAAVENLNRLVPYAILAALAVPSAPYLTRLWMQLAAALVFTALAFVFGAALFSAAFAPVLSAMSSLNHAEIYLPPYDWHVEVPAYLSFVEPVLSCFLILALIWDQLDARLALRMLQFCVLMLAIKGSLLSPFIFIFFAQLTPTVALMSRGQFSLEALTLVFLAALVWRSALSTRWAHTPDTR